MAKIKKAVNKPLTAYQKAYVETHRMIDNTLDSSGTVQQSYELFKVEGTIKPTGITFKSDAEYSEWFKNESHKVLDEGVSYIMFRTLKKIK